MNDTNTEEKLNEKINKEVECVVTKNQQKQEKKKHTKKKQQNQKQQYECTKEEYTILLVQASSLSIEEAKLELLECSRYGEIDAVCAILDTFQHQTIKNKEQVTLFINSKDDNGNTALHKSCANGHMNVTTLLLQRGIDHTCNNSGNTSLHWAAANGHKDCVEAILKNYDSEIIDVLQKNNFGRSALTEGFTSQVTEVVGLLLEHDSAEEEKLIGGDEIVKEEVDVDDVDESSPDTELEESSKKEEIGVVHEFDFRPSSSSCNKNESSHNDNNNSLCVRELAIKHADNPFGNEPIDDTTGLGIWCASIIMSRWIADDNNDNGSYLKEKLKDKIMLELGAGCGVPALTAALYCNPKSVHISDLNPETVENIKHNIRLNESKLLPHLTNNIHGVSLDWDDVSTYPKMMANNNSNDNDAIQKFDYILGADLIYQDTTIPILKNILYKLLKPNAGIFLYVAPKDYLRHGLSDFIQQLQMKEHNNNDNYYFECVSQKDAPDEYKINPLVSKDDDDCFLHFHELSSIDYVLYEFILKVD